MTKKIEDVEKTIPNAGGSATTAVFNTKIGKVEIKISYVIGLVKKTVCDAKISQIEGKYYKLHTSCKNKIKISINEYNICNFVKSYDLNKKLITLITKAELKARQDKTIKLQTCDLNYFLDKAFVWS